jgi:hypothetical protein
LGRVMEAVKSDVTWRRRTVIIDWKNMNRMGRLGAEFKTALFTNTICTDRYY